MIQYLAAFVNTDPLPKAGASDDTVKTVLNIVLGTMGAIAFLMIVLAGLRYTLSQGEPDKVAESKRIITYSIVGLVVIALAATIVNFVVGRI